MHAWSDICGSSTDYPLAVHRVTGVDPLLLIVTVCNVVYVFSCRRPHQTQQPALKDFLISMRSVGILLLRGDKVPDRPDDLSPVPPTAWRDLPWPDAGALPRKGYYSSPKAAEECMTVDDIVFHRIASIVNSL